MRLRGFSAAPPPISSCHPDWSNWPSLPSALLAPPSSALVRDVTARWPGNGGGSRRRSEFVFSGFHVHRHCLLPSFQTRTAEVVSTSGELSFFRILSRLCPNLSERDLCYGTVVPCVTVRDRADPYTDPPSQTPYSQGPSGNEGSRLPVSRGSDVGNRPRFRVLSRRNEEIKKRASCSLMCSKLILLNPLKPNNVRILKASTHPPVLGRVIGVVGGFARAKVRWPGSFLGRVRSGPG